jgi:S-DNA-T family DNA segregation ATPase FtsK/SpoIIIE
MIVAENVKNLSNISFDKWYKKHVTQSDGIWVGNGITDQYQLKVTKNTSEMRDEITDEFGFAIKNGKPSKIKLLCLKKEDE